MLDFPFLYIQKEVLKFLKTRTIKFQAISTDFKWFIKYLYNIIYITYSAHVAYITDIFYIIYIHNSYTKLVSETYEKIFFINFFIKKTNNYYQKYKKTSKRKKKEGFLLSKEEIERKIERYPERYQNFTKREKEKRHNENLSEKQKQKLGECRRKYNLTQSK